MFTVGGKKSKKIKITYSTPQSQPLLTVYCVVFHSFLYINIHRQSLSTHLFRLLRNSQTSSNVPLLSEHQTMEFD